MAAEEGQVISCHTLDSWKEQLQKGGQSKKLEILMCLFLGKICYRFCNTFPIKSSEGQYAVVTEQYDTVVVDFTASWCGPCRFISPFLAELAKKFPNVMFLKVDVDELKEVAAEWDVDAMPTFLFLKEGKAVEKVVGAKKEELQQAVTKHMATSMLPYHVFEELFIMYLIFDFLLCQFIYLLGDKKIEIGILGSTAVKCHHCCLFGGVGTGKHGLRITLEITTEKEDFWIQELHIKQWPY
ncbi:hypothetical protein GOBAR_AA33657 [Gossypium barbadense]|uniref:Thioredoxin domain-containing protein n=1 Tax=Gossypium barbadense TaxID=3634 RepID=A0A2P5W7F8_GOSBA|nr:hypothetical protein GOBAR_AA33657 [Gossypium barbadense]